MFEIILSAPPCHKRFLTHGGHCLALVLTLLLPQLGISAKPDQKDVPARQPAVFRVTSDVVNANVGGFAATIGGTGNTLITEGGGFEPVVYRTRVTALEDAADRVVASPAALSRYDSLREGFFDGASVHIYRIVDGRFKMVREDRVAQGGAHASGWIPAFDENKLVAPNQTSYKFHWDPWNRPGAKYYFAVRAVSQSGRGSEFSKAIEVESPPNLDKLPRATPAVDLRPFTPGKAPSDGNVSPAPGSFRGELDRDGTLALSWNAVAMPDLAGYIVYRSDYAPQQHSGYYLQLAARAKSPEQAVRSGDMVIVSKKIYTPSRNRLLTNRVWGAENEYSLLLPGLVHFFPDESPEKSWGLVPHGADTPVEEAGETCMKLHLSAGKHESLYLYNHSGTGQDWYEVLSPQPYTVEVWMRQEGQGSVKFKLAGFYDSSPQKISPQVFRVGSEWKKYVATFTPRVVEPGDSPGTMGLEFSGPATFYVDNFRVYRQDSAFMDLPATDYVALKLSAISALRTHGFVKTGFHTYDMDQFTNPGGVISGTPKNNTLPQMLGVIRKAELRPWLQVEFHMSPREWLGLVEYLAAPYDPQKDNPKAKPWAYKRYMQGHAKPWTDDFDKLYFELSNETWNGLFVPWTFGPMADGGTTRKNYSPGQVYGLYQEFVIGTMKSSPYWNAARLDNKISFVLGGQTVNPGYGLDAAQGSPSSEYVTIGAYNGGWDEGEGPPPASAASIFDTLAHVNQAAIPQAVRLAREVSALNVNRAKPLRIGTYESGPGYAMNGLNGAKVDASQMLAQEQVMKSLGAGTATLDAFLARAYRGFTLQNFFSFGAGDRWHSHANWYQGGQAYPSWKALALFNNEGTGDMLRVDTLSAPRANLAAHDRRAALDDVPLVGAYATRKGNRYNLFLVSRKVPRVLSGDDGYTAVRADLPFTKAKSIAVYRMTGDPLANNLLTDNIKIKKIELSPSVLKAGRFEVDGDAGADERGLPPASTFLYVFEDATR